MAGLVFQESFGHAVISSLTEAVRVVEDGAVGIVSLGSGAVVAELDDLLSALSVYHAGVVEGLQGLTDYAQMAGASLDEAERSLTSSLAPAPSFALAPSLVSASTVTGVGW